MANQSSLSNSVSNFFASKFGGKKILGSESTTGSVSSGLALNVDPNAPKVIVLAMASGECDGNDGPFNWYFDNIHREGNKLVIVHVIDLPDLKSQTRSNVSPGVLANMWKAEETKIKDLEMKLKIMLKERKCNGILRTTSGKPGEAIAAIAREEKATMIVTGSRNQGKFKRALLGSTSDHLVHHAHCPVVVCRLDTVQSNMSGSQASSAHEDLPTFNKNPFSAKPNLPPAMKD